MSPCSCPTCGCSCSPVTFGPYVFRVQQTHVTELRLVFPRPEVAYASGRQWGKVHPAFSPGFAVPEGYLEQLPPVDLQRELGVRDQKLRAQSAKPAKHKKAIEDKKSSVLPPQLQLRSNHGFWSKGRR
jgi:hypothetical protein